MARFFLHLASFIFGGLPANYDAIIGLIVIMDVAGAVTFEINSCIRSYHAYGVIWTPNVNKHLSYNQETNAGVIHGGSNTQKHGCWPCSQEDI